MKNNKIIINLANHGKKVKKQCQKKKKTLPALNPLMRALNMKNYALLVYSTSRTTATKTSSRMGFSG